MKLLYIVPLLVGSIALGGCQTGGEKETSGTLIGVAGGAVVGAAIGGGGGAAVGAVGGGLLGKYIGKSMDEDDKKKK